MSMMTTAQSEIATDLDAFAEATWFTSAYLVRYAAAPFICSVRSDLQMTDMWYQDCNVQHHASCRPALTDIYTTCVRLLFESSPIPGALHHRIGEEHHFIPTGTCSLWLRLWGVDEHIDHSGSRPG